MELGLGHAGNGSTGWRPKPLAARFLCCASQSRRRLSAAQEERLFGSCEYGRNEQVTPALVFSGSYESRKGRELEANPRAAGTLYWRETMQQITVEGPVRRLAESESDVIFGERPADAKATTVASRQGAPLDDPAALRRKADAPGSADEPLSRPPRWGGFRLDPDLIEFWHGSPDRLHRRLLYVKQDDRWTHRRLQP